MKELSLNILDIAENSVKAGAKLVSILVEETDRQLTLTISDDGCGMKPDFLQSVLDPFTTTRTTRRVGMGLPLLKLAAEQTGGGVQIKSRHVSDFPETHGTDVIATFFTDHIDFTPMGDIISTLLTLIQGNPNMDLVFRHHSGALAVLLDTREMREVLGDVSLNEPEVLTWLRQNMEEQYQSV